MENSEDKKKKKYVSKREWIKQQQEKPVTLEDVKSYALFLLNSRDYTEQRMRDKLAQRYARDKQYNEDVMTLLLSSNFIDDMRFVEVCVTSFLHQKIGPSKIKQKLYAKGFSSKAIETAMQLTGDKDYLSDARALIERKYKGKPFDDHKEKQKAMAFLVRQGFSFDIANKAISGSYEDDWEC